MIQSRYPSVSTVRNLRERFPAGTRVELDYMDDPYGVPVGTRGTVNFVDDIGTVHVRWDSGSSLGLVYGEDRFHKVTEE